MKKALPLALAAGLLLAASPSFASKQSNCRLFYDKFYMACFKYGKQHKSEKACDKATTAMEQELLNEAESVKEEGIASFLATVCDSACNSGAEAENPPSYGDFQNDFCK